jgi:hypothetical protein
MKKQSSRARARTASRARHQFDHVVPTVIHDPEEKMTALGRWTHRALQKPKKYWGWAAAIAGGLFTLVVIWNLATGGRSRASEVWARLEATKDLGDRVELAKDLPNSPVKTWALFQAGTEYYDQALRDLPQNREVAGPISKKALDLFEQVERDAPRDSPQARAAALGKARTLELRNELPKAIAQYQLVVEKWPGSSEAAQAQRLAQALKEPEAVQFYKDLYAYSPTKMTLPPFGSESLPIPGVSAPVPATTPKTSSQPAITPDSLPEVFPPDVREVKVAPKTTPPPAKAGPSQPGAIQPDLPADVFSPNSQSKPAAAPQ